MGPKWSPETFKMEPKSFQNRTPNRPKIRKIVSRPSKMEPRGGQDGQKIENLNRPNKKVGEFLHGRPFLSQRVTNMAPSWLPKSIKNRSKIDAKIDQKFDASLDRFLGGFWKPKWSHVGTQRRPKRRLILKAP